MDDLLNSVLEITPGATGGFDADGNWVSSSVADKFSILCSIQPFKTMGRHSVILPSGVTQSDVFTVYSRCAVKCGNLDDEPDTTFIKGYKYYAWREVDWSMIGLDIDHHEFYLVRILVDGKPVPESEDD